MKLFFRKYGQGPPVLILHGLFGTSDNWQTISNELAKKNTIYALDLRNHGRSPHSPEMNYTLMTEDIYEFLTDFNLRKISVIGHSMGGKAAMQFACEYPHRVQKLVVVDIAPRTYHLLHQNIIDALKSINLIKIQSRQDADKQLANQIYSQVMRQFFLKNLYRLQDGKFAWRLNLEAIEKNLPLLGEGLKKNNKFEKPALFIRGSNSDFIKEDDFEKIKFHFPAAEITTIKNATHWLHVEKTEKFLNLIKSFL